MMNLADATLIADAYLSESPPRKAGRMLPPLPDEPTAADLASAAGDVAQFLRDLAGRLNAATRVASARRELYAAIAMHALIGRREACDPDTIGRYAWSVADAVERHRSFVEPPKADDSLQEAPLDLVDNDHDGMG